MADMVNDHLGLERQDNEEWCDEHRAPYSLCGDTHPMNSPGPAGKYTSMIRRAGDGADVDGTADPLVQEPKR
jgi:hypothetical protein